MFLPGIDPDAVYKKLVEEVYYSGSLYGDWYILPTTTVKCYAVKRYLTTTGVNLPDIYEATLRLIYEPAELDSRVKELFNTGRDGFLREGCSLITWFGFAEVRNNTLNFTITLRNLDVVNGYADAYTYYVLLLELVAAVTGFRVGSITFFLNNVSMLNRESNVVEQIQKAQSYTYKTNPLITTSYEHLVSYAKYTLDMCEEYREKPGKDFDLSVVTDPGWRDMLAVIMFNIKMNIQDLASAKNCIDLMDPYSYEWLWCMKRMEGTVQHVNT